jgi:hypothetical protein
LPSTALALRNSHRPTTHSIPPRSLSEPSQHWVGEVSPWGLPCLPTSSGIGEHETWVTSPTQSCRPLDAPCQLARSRKHPQRARLTRTMAPEPNKSWPREGYTPEWLAVGSSETFSWATITPPWTPKYPSLVVELALTRNTDRGCCGWQICDEWRLCR